MTAHAHCGCSHRKWEQPRAMVSVRMSRLGLSSVMAPIWQVQTQLKWRLSEPDTLEFHLTLFFLLHFACKLPFVCLLRGHVQVPESRTRNRGMKPSASVAACIHEAEISSQKFR